MDRTDPVRLLFARCDLKQAAAMAMRLEWYGVRTIEQFYGVLNPYLPDLKDRPAARKGLTRSYRSLRRRALSDADRLRKIRKVLGLQDRDARRVLDSLGRVPFPKQERLSGRTALSLGLRPPASGKRSRYWRSVETVRVARPAFLLPEYDRMGPVFDQGSRGTCVANAALAQLDYITGSDWSRQFAYHQCKMLDGLPDSEGTFLETMAEVLCSDTEKDLGVVREKVWRYNGTARGTPHQGPPPEPCFRAVRAVGHSAVFVRKATVIQDIKKLLTGQGGAQPLPVVVGLVLHETFDNYYSARTGLINLPLPGEAALGGHAMLVVGWFEQEQVFLVRNSWESGWAPENPKGFPGHALIPYRYFPSYCLSGFSLSGLVQQTLTVAHQDRLHVKALKRARTASRDRGRDNSKRFFSRLSLFNWRR